jgi:carbon monoxide dehydrogenase subunit G
MTEFVSQTKTLPYNEEEVYTVLSDLSNLERVKEKIPADKIQDVTFDRDSCSFSINPVGKVRFSIVDREPFKTIKFTADESPVEVSLWIQLKQIEENDTKMKVTVRAELNPFLKPMLSKPLQEGVDKIADVLAAIQYNETLAKKY